MVMVMDTILPGPLMVDMLPAMVMDIRNGYEYQPARSSYGGYTLSSNGYKKILKSKGVSIIFNFWME